MTSHSSDGECSKLDEVGYANVVRRHADLLSVYVDFLPCGFRYDLCRRGSIDQRCTQRQASQHQCQFFLCS